VRTNETLECRPLGCVAQDVPCLTQVIRGRFADYAVDDLDRWSASAATRRNALWRERDNRQVGVCVGQPSRLAERSYAAWS
jgi:hypothetical protein